VKVAIDLTQIDNQTLGSGQYRYAVDLANGLAVHAPEVDVTLLGTTDRARDEFAPALERSGSVRYARLAKCHGVAEFYRDVLKLSASLTAARIDILHQIHTKIPFPKPCRVIVTAHHYYYDAPLFASRPHRYYQWALRTRADLVITVSDATRDDFHQHFRVPLDRMRTVYHGLSPTLASGAGRRRERPYILSPYNLSGPKNLRSLVLAWPRIAERHPDVDLVLYGRSLVTPEREAEFERLLAGTAAAGRVYRVGYVPDADLADLFAGCALFVFPTTVEGFGYPLLEAMAHGACCITRNASAMKEIGGDAVCLIETLNPDAIAAAAVELLGDPTTRAALGVRAAARARVFTIEEMVRRTVGCYRSLA
jgi:glycosyltransferase involved in cell wall biosynthesis